MTLTTNKILNAAGVLTEAEHQTSCETRKRITGKFPTRGDLILAVLDWVLAEQLAGRRPNDHDVAQQFELSLEDTIDLHVELEEMGEV